MKPLVHLITPMCSFTYVSCRWFRITCNQVDRSKSTACTDALLCHPKAARQRNPVSLYHPAALDVCRVEPSHTSSKWIYIIDSQDTVTFDYLSYSYIIGLCNPTFQVLKIPKQNWDCE